MLWHVLDLTVAIFRELSLTCAAYVLTYTSRSCFTPGIHSSTKNILAGPDIKPRTVGESQAKANQTRNSAEEVGVAGPHTSPTTRRHSKSSLRMESSGHQILWQAPNNMAQNNPGRDKTARQNMEWSQRTRQESSQMAKLCEGPMFPTGMMGHYYYYYYYYYIPQKVTFPI
jgi:hypothetical protein